jgi:hypothetical protein
LLGAGSAAGSLTLARSGDDRRLLAVRVDMAEVGLSDGAGAELLRSPSSGVSRRSVRYGSSSGGDRDPETAPPSVRLAVLPGARPRPVSPT